MFDYLGTYSDTQLKERHDFLRSRIFAIPAMIDHLQVRAKRLGGELSEARVTQFPITNRCGDTVYNLTTSHVPVVYTAGSFIHAIQHGAGSSGFPLRVDPLTEDISHGDSTWRPFGRLFQVGQRDSDPDQIGHDDIVPAEMSKGLIDKFRGAFRRPEVLEEKGKKARYQFMRIQDEILILEKTLITFQDELTAIEALSSNEQTIINSAGETETVSEYPSASIDNKTDILPEDDFELLLALVTPPASEPDGEGELVTTITATPPGTIQPIDVDENSPPGDLEAFNARFPLPSNPAQHDERTTIPIDRLQILANIFTYNFGIMLKGVPTTNLFWKNNNATFHPPNIMADLITFADLVAERYPGVAIRVTEAWPPTVNHSDLGGHFTGNSVDVTLVLSTNRTKNNPSGKLATDQKLRTFGITTNVLAEQVMTLGKEANLFNSAKNEYVWKTKQWTGAHIHLGWKGAKAIHNNDIRLLTLGLSKIQSSKVRIP